MATTTIEKPFFEFTAFCRETEEIRTCTNLKVLYDAIRRDFRIWPEESGLSFSSKIWKIGILILQFPFSKWNIWERSNPFPIFFLEFFI